MARGVTDFDSRIDTIDAELQKLGYSNLKAVVTQQIDSQEITFKNLFELKSVSLDRV